MIKFRRIQQAVTAFRKKDDGSAAIELLFMVPILSFLTFSMVAYFSVFRAQTIAARASTVITDMVSREAGAVTPAYLAGIEGLFTALVTSDDNPDYRLTAYYYDEDEDTFEVVWSKTTGGYEEMDNIGLNEVSNRLPDLRDGQRSLLMETSVDYEPIFNVGIGNRTFENFFVTAPRFVARLCYKDSESAEVDTTKC